MKKILMAILMSLMLLSCFGGGSSSNDKVFRLNLSAEGDTLDTAIVTDATGITLHGLLSEGLSKLNPETQKFEPGLAESWDVSEDGLTWTFHLRENLKWSNGEKLTAHDFEYSWLRALDPNTASQYAYMLFPILNAEEYNAGKVGKETVGVKALDDLTLEVKLHSPVQYFDSLVAFVTYLPQNQKFVEEQGDMYALEPENLLYSGPFVITSWDHNSSMTLEKNENYYAKDEIGVDKVEVKYINDSAASLNAYKNDEIDVVKLTAEQLEEYKDSSELHTVNQASLWYLEYNTTNKFLSNKNVRKAILEAIDKENIVETIYNGIYEASYSLTPKNVGMKGLEKDFVEEAGTTVPKFNVEQAKADLAKGLAELGMDKAPTLSIILNDGGSNKKVGELIQEMLRSNLGLELNIEVMTFKERLQRMKNKNFDIILAGWSADYQDPMTFLDLFVTNGGNNHGGYSSKEYDENIRIAKTTTDKKERVNAMIKVENLIGEDLPIAPLFQPRNIFLAKEKVKGLSFTSIGSDMVFNKLRIEK